MLKVYGVFDRKLREHGQLVTAKNDFVVTRSFVDSVRGSKSLMEAHPEDFDLVCVGEFDAESGVLKGTPPRLVYNLKELLDGSVGVDEDVSPVLRKEA